MPKFTYTARNRSGQSVSDVLDAPSRKDALRLLSARGLQPVTIGESIGAAKVEKRKSKTKELSDSQETGVRHSKKTMQRSRVNRQRRERHSFTTPCVYGVPESQHPGCQMLGRIFVLRFEL